MDHIKRRFNWILIMIVFSKTPVLHITNLVKIITPTVLKPWSWKVVVPTAIGASSVHGLTGATTYVTSNSSNTVQGTSGDSFNYSFWSGGNYRAYSFRVDGLPQGLTYNGNAWGPLISGTLPPPGNYNIAITGYRYPGLSGNSTPTFNLNLTVSAAQNHTLNLVAGQGGTVSGGGTFPQGTSRTITATPSSGYNFSSWSGTGIANNNSATTTVIITGPKTVTANFSPIIHTLTLNSGAGGSVSGGGNFNHGQSPSITATPNVGHRFVSWGGSGVANPSLPTTTVTMTQPRTITANFQPLSYSLTVIAGNGGTAIGSGTFNHGHAASISATPQTGYSFSSWTGTGLNDPSAPTTSVDITQTRTVTANFLPINYTLSLVAGAGGSVSGAGSYSFSSTPTITATPTVGYEFSSWQGDGADDPTSSTTTVAMTQTRSLTAIFSLLSHSLDLTAGAGGTVAGGGTFAHGQSTTITATPSAGYSFSSWSGGNVTDSSAKNTTVEITQPLSLVANFTPLEFPLTLTANPGGTVTGTGNYTYGSSPTITAVPDFGFQFESWSGSGVADPSSPTTTVSISGSKSVNASFTPLDFSLSVSSQVGGSVSGGGTFPFGTRTPINAIPNPSHVFQKWVGSGLDDSNSSSTFVTVSGNLNIVANFTVKPATNRSLVLLSSPSDGGIAVGSGSYPQSTSVPIVATPSSSHDFVGWSGNGVADPSSAATSVLLSSDENVTALFVLKTHTLLALPASGGIVSGGGSFPHGSQAVVSAVPSPGYVFTRWSGNGLSNPSIPTTSISMTQDRNVSAVFTPEIHTVVLSLSDGGFATGSGTYTHGTVAELNATPQTGYFFNGWSGGTFADPNSSSTTIVVDRDMTITPSFTPTSHILQVLSGTGGAVTGGGTYQYGASVSITATPNDGFSFVGWTGSTPENPSMPSTTFTITRDSNLTAVFTRITHTLSVNASTGGSVSGSGSYLHGSTASLTASPDSGYRFIGWSGSSVSDANSSQTSILIEESVSVFGTFEKASVSSHTNAQSLGANWYSSWLGTFYQTSGEWCFHMDLGWIYISIEGSTGAWVWKEMQGWLWTDPTRYADLFLWSENFGEWVYLDSASNLSPRIFRYSTASWSEF